MSLLNQLQAFGQGASNSIASNVTAPVDGIAWLLRKAGLNIPEPVGGSGWAARQGLTRPAPGVAGLLGEVSGGVGPAYAAMKAPQIAGGLLAAGQNAVAVGPSSGKFGKQLGMIDFPPNFSRPEKSDAIKKMAEDFAEKLNGRGFHATIDHSGSAMGPSSYVKVFDPETGRFLVDPVRFSDHGKGAIQSQFVNEVFGPHSAPNIAPYIDAAEAMRAMGPTEVFAMQKEREAIGAAKRAAKEAKKLVK